MNPFPTRALTACLAAWAIVGLGSIGGSIAVRGGEGREHVRGITISCQGWGREWGTDGFAEELDALSELGANWVAIHPYARIGEDGSVRWRSFDVDAPPPWLARPIEEARRRGMGILIKPHLAYWGSSFSWRGAIDFEDPGAVERFFSDYRDWVVALALATREADAFSVGCELERLVHHEDEWRGIIAEVRSITDARLTYAANWEGFEEVPFWDALDAIGVQAYFPLSEERDPDRAELERGWEAVLGRLRGAHERTGKPVVFTELGYSSSLDAARRPWSGALARGADLETARDLKLRCLTTGLEVLERERAWLRGVFLWKWFVGEPGRHDRDFRLDTPEVRRVIQGSWAGN